jgi:hypothetical protein
VCVMLCVMLDDVHRMPLQDAQMPNNEPRLLRQRRRGPLEAAGLPPSNVACAAVAVVPAVAAAAGAFWKYNTS